MSEKDLKTYDGKDAKALLEGRALVGCRNEAGDLMVLAPKEIVPGLAAMHVDDFVKALGKAGKALVVDVRPGAKMGTVNDYIHTVKGQRPQIVNDTPPTPRPPVPPRPAAAPAPIVEHKPFSPPVSKTIEQAPAAKPEPAPKPSTPKKSASPKPAAARKPAKKKRK